MTAVIFNNESDHTSGGSYYHIDVVTDNSKASASLALKGGKHNILKKRNYF